MNTHSSLPPPPPPPTPPPSNLSPVFSLSASAILSLPLQPEFPICFMASPSPLHNFLPKWSVKQSSNHHRDRKSSESPPPPDSVLRDSMSSETTPVRRQSPLLDSVRRLDAGKRQSSEMESERRMRLADESSRIRIDVSPRDQAIERPPAIVGRDQAFPKLKFRLPKIAKAPDAFPEKPKSAGGRATPQEAKSQSQQAAANRPEANCSRGAAVQAPAEKSDKKPKFSVFLTDQDIADDILSLTGAKPKRHTKRARNVQKQLDNLYPGLWLVNSTPGLYEVPETSKAKKTIK